jgi:hypothetical protein
VIDWRESGEAWLAGVLVPLARRTAGDPGTSAAVLRAHPEVRALREDDFAVYRSEGAEFAGDLRIVAVATLVAHWAGDTPVAVDARDVIVCLAYLDAIEYARWRDLYGFELSPVMIEAEDNFDRWTAINDQVGRAFLDWTGGLARDLPTPVNDA